MVKIDDEQLDYFCYFVKIKKFMNETCVTYVNKCLNIFYLGD